MVFTIWSGLGKEKDIRDNFRLECFECKIGKVRNVRMREQVILSDGKEP